MYRILSARLVQISHICYSAKGPSWPDWPAWMNPSCRTDWSEYPCLRLKYIRVFTSVVLEMYWYISFLRPPPISVSCSASSIITITPQIANDLRTECVSPNSGLYNNDWWWTTQFDLDFVTSQRICTIYGTAFILLPLLSVHQHS